MHLSELELNCAACMDSLKVDRGCEKDSPIPGRWQIGDLEFQRCPKKVIDPSVYEYLRAYNRFEKGFLPNSGGWFDQSAKFNHVIDIIERELAEIERIEIEKQTGGKK